MKKQSYYDRPAIEFDERGYFRRDCDCGKIHEVLTQADDDPEYRTGVKIICECDRRVHFSLPVN